MNKTIKVPFNRDIQNYLAEHGFTHLYNEGIASNRSPIRDDSDIDYIIIPIKANDPHFNGDDTSQKIEEIKSNETFDMADGDPFTRFVLELPVKEYEKYLKS
jgi:hypothetical protein